MAYVKIIFQNSPSTATPMNAENLNHMDNQIALNDQRLTEIETSYVKSFNGRKGEVVPEKNDYDISLIGATAGEDGYVPVWRNSGTEEDPDWGFEMEAQGGAGHVLVDSDGNDMPSEDKMQFADAFLSDDDVNGKTVVENIKEVAPADYDSTTDEGIIVCDDGEDAVIHPSSEDYVEVTADGVKTYGQLLNEIYSDVDKEVTFYSSLMIGNNVYIPVLIYSSQYAFINSTMNGNNGNMTFRRAYLSSSSSYLVNDEGTYRNDSNTICPSGTKITLYYGNKKAVVDLQTTANRCLMPDGESKVSDTIDISSLMTPNLSAGATFRARRNVNTISITFNGTMSTNASAVIKNIPSFMQGNETYICGYVYYNSTFYPLIRYGSNLYCDIVFPQGATIIGNATMIV